MAYAETTKVPFDQTVAELTDLLRRRGAGQIFQGEDAGFFAIQFSLADRAIRFRVGLIDDKSKRPADQQRRQRMRALLLVVKAKLESVDSGVETIEQAFLANVVMADGQTVYERVAGPMALEYTEGRPSPVAGLLAGPLAA